MNDRFKFRAWDKDNSKMQDVNVLALGEDLTWPHSLSHTHNTEYWDSDDGLTIGAILMQCTGIKDKNGTLIYEGDILSCGTKSTERGVMEWVNTFDRSGWSKFSPINRFEVIGNIHENRELLEGKS